MSDQPYKKKLIEVALPLDAINREAAREKSIRHGHPSTLHLWWARRPLAACRAVLFAQLVDDPSAHPEQFPTEDAQERERQRLFDLIEKIVKWENTEDRELFDQARAEIVKSCGEPLPTILDPFAGGGSIPLEAQRLGLEAHATDLNPIAVLINKALIEIPPRWADQRPVHPADDGRLAAQAWRSTDGLIDDVRYYGDWMRTEAEARIGHLYPPVDLPDGSSAPVIAWLWARAVTCPNPACGAAMPLVRSFWLGKKKGREAWVEPSVVAGAVKFVVHHSSSGPPMEGTVGRAGATCVVCLSPVPLNHIRDEGKAGRIGVRLMAVVADSQRHRVYVSPDEVQVEASIVGRPADLPEHPLPHNPRDFKTPNYGMSTFASLFTDRQLTAMATISDLVSEARLRVQQDALASGMSIDDAAAYSDALAIYLALAWDRVADSHCSLTRWKPSMDQSIGLFSRQAVPMVWDFAEVNPFGHAAGDLRVSIETVCKVLKRLPARGIGEAKQVVAAKSIDSGVVIATDPPYYDNIGYADLSDFFYVWLRRSLRSVLPDLFGTVLTPKAEELIAAPYRFDGNRDEAERHFRDGFVETFAAAAVNQAPSVPMTIFYAFKQSETDALDGATASTGWETMLHGLLDAGLMVTATWPVRTEMGNRMLSSGTNALASSIVLACRPRPGDAKITDRRGFLDALRRQLPRALREMQQGSVAPVDLAQSAIGPGMAVFSEYAKVVEPSGSAMVVRTALALINQVLDEVLAEQEGEFDSDTRWAVKWFEQYGFDHGSFDSAETLFKATGTALNGLKASGIVASEKGKVWLINRDELPEEWDPATDARTPVWEATQHLVKRLDQGGEQAAADLLRILGGVGDTSRELAYRLYAITEKKGWAKEGGAYNALVVAWPDIQRAAAVERAETYEAGQML